MRADAVTLLFTDVRGSTVAHGGQALLTEQAREALGEAGDVRDVGYHRLKDLPAPEHLFQLLAPGLQSEAVALRLALAATLAAAWREPLGAATLWGAAEHMYASVGLDDVPISASLKAQWQPVARDDAPDQASWRAAWKAGTSS